MNHNHYFNMTITPTSYKIELTSQELHRIASDLVHAFQYRLSYQTDITVIPHIERPTLAMLKVISEVTDTNYERMALEAVDEIIQQNLKKQSEKSNDDFIWGD